MLNERYSTLRYCIGLFVVLLLSVGTTTGQDPDGPHPRIFLNPAVIAELQQKIGNNTPEWQQVEEYLDQYLIEDPWGHSLYLHRKQL